MQVNIPDHNTQQFYVFLETDTQTWAMPGNDISKREEKILRNDWDNELV